MRDRQDGQEQGSISNRLEEIILHASLQWRKRLTLTDIVQGAKINIKTITSLIDNATNRFDYGTLSNLCWYFGCNIQHILIYTPPRGVFVPDPEPIQIQRQRIPDANEENKGKVICRLKIYLSREEGKVWFLCKKLAFLTHISPDTVYALVRNQSTRIDATTLVALCHYYRIQPGELLHYYYEENHSEVN